MSIRKAFPVTLGLMITTTWVAAAPAQEALKEPGRLGVKPVVVSANQQIADAIAERLRAEVSLKQERVDILYADGVAELTGLVADAGQRDLVLRVVQGVPGVERVRNRLSLRSGELVRAQAAQPMAPNFPVLGGPALGGPAQAGPPLGAPPAGLQEPLPIYQAPPGPNPNVQPPPLPPYAWPGYAPYNNYSRVAYPETYPYQSWPFIGPMYPYPKVPLGWRKVSLEWQDGYWWYSKGPTGHDWWRIRYW